MLVSEQQDQWARFWCPRDGELFLDARGFLVDPERGIFRRHRRFRRLVELLDVPCLLLLGEPGMGKSTALKQAYLAAEARRREDIQLLRIDLKSQRLDRDLRTHPAYVGYVAGDHPLELFIDSLDESLDPNAALDLLGPLLLKPVPGLRLRIACRTGEVPLALEQELRELWQRFGEDPDEAVQPYELAPLRETDVRASATREGVDEDRFLDEVEQRNAGPLAARPITLTRFLLPQFKRTGTFPRTRWELYEKGCRIMCEDLSPTRADSDRVGTLSSGQRLAVASRLAAVCLLSHRNAVSRGAPGPMPTEEPPEGTGNVSFAEISMDEVDGGTEPVGDGTVEVDRGALRDVIEHSALFTARGAHHFGWGHQTFAEFLTAYYLVHRRLENAELAEIVFPDEISGVPFALRGVAAWLMSQRPGLFQHFTARDVSVALRSDLGILEQDQRAVLVATLLDQAERREFSDDDLALRDSYRHLHYTGLAEQLAPWLRDKDRFLVARRVAVEIAEACSLTSLADDLLALALDPDDEEHLRPRAAHALQRLGSPEHFGRLKALLALSREADPRDELLGSSLAVLWPDHLSAAELFAALRPTRNRMFSGSYELFVGYDLAPSLTDDDLPLALDWLAALDREALRWHALEICDAAVVRRAWNTIDDASVANALVCLVVARFRRHVPLVPHRAASEDEGTMHSPGTAARRTFLRAFVASAAGEPIHAADYLYRNGLILAIDAEWLVSTLDGETEGRVYWLEMAHVLAAVLVRDGMTLDVFIDAADRHPDLAEALRPYIGPIALDSEMAARMRREWQLLQEGEAERAARRAYRLEPPPEQRVEEALRTAEAGALQKLPQLYDDLSLRVDSEYYDRSSIDLTSYPGWATADAATRARIVEVSKRYLLATDPSLVSQINKDPGSEVAEAGCRALFLILQVDPPWLGERLPGRAVAAGRRGPKFWGRWIPVILTESVQPRGRASRAALLRLAYQGERVQFLDALAAVLTSAQTFQCALLRQAWDDALAARLCAKLDDPQLSEYVLKSIIEELAAHQYANLDNIMRSLVPLEVPRDDHRRGRARAAAWSLLTHNPERSWPHLSAVFEHDADFAQEVATHIAGMRFSDAIKRWIGVSSMKIADIYIWLVRIAARLSPQRPSRLLGRFDESTTLRFALSALLNLLIARGASASEEAFERIRRQFPERDEVAYAYNKAREVRAASAWRPLQPRQILALGSPSRLLIAPPPHAISENCALSAERNDMLDVLLICALKDEYDQVRAVTDGLQHPGWVEQPGPRGWIVAEGSFATSAGPPLRIRTTWATHTGRENAVAVASLLIQNQPARCLAMSGICAGRRGKVALGDVIFADRLWSYDVGKRTVEDGEEKFQGDMLQFNPAPVWIQRMQQVTVPPETLWLSQRPRFPLEYQEDWLLQQLLAGKDPRSSSEHDQMCPDWTAVVSRLWQRKWLDKPLTLTDGGRARAAELAILHPRGLPAPPTFQVHVAPIATGAEVTEDPGIFPRLAGSMRKILGVEMEASALGALGVIHGVPVVVAKGVSDYGDSFKDDRYRAFAARAAAECLIALLRKALDLLPGSGVGPESGILSRTDATRLPEDLISALADEYPDVRDARGLWERAGGRGSEVENISRPRDLWQRLWLRSTKGASVRPEELLKAALQDSPNSPVLLHYMGLLKAPQV